MREDEMNYTDRELIMGSEMDVDNMPERALKSILAELKQGNKLAAIKIYREVTGAGLKEAKDAIESVKIKETYQKPITNNMRYRNKILNILILAAILLVLFKLLG